MDNFIEFSVLDRMNMFWMNILDFVLNWIIFRPNSMKKMIFQKRLPTPNSGFDQCDNGSFNSLNWSFQENWGLKGETISFKNYWWPWKFICAQRGAFDKTCIHDGLKLTFWRCFWNWKWLNWRNIYERRRQNQQQKLSVVICWFY